MGLVSAVLAIGPNGEFGNDDPEFYGLPFDSKMDMRWFYNLTLSQKILLSQKTFVLAKTTFPGRSVYIATRKGITNPEGGSVTLANISSDIFICGGATIYKKYLEETDLVFVSIINRVHVDKTDTYFSLDEYFKAGFYVAYCGSSVAIVGDDINNLVVLAKRTESTNFNRPSDRVIKLIAEYFEPYIKLRVKENCTIAPGAHAQVEIMTPVYVPVNQTGIFSIRKQLARQGLYTSAISFKRSWIGKPQITITNNSHALVELKAGEEIGEISFVNNNSFQ